MALIRKMMDGLTAMKSIQLHGPQTCHHRMPVFSITCPGTDPSDLANILEEEFHIKNRVGLHCAPWAHETLGTAPFGTVRLSPGIFQTDEDIDYMLDCLDRAVTRLKK